MTQNSTASRDAINALVVELNQASSVRDFRRMDELNDLLCRKIYGHLREIGQYIAQIAAPISGEGGDHDYDGAMQHVWLGVHDQMGILPKSCMLVTTDDDCAALNKTKRDRTTKKGYIRKGVSSGVRLRIYKRDQYRCRSCGSQESLSIDHIHPVSEGGDNRDANLQTLCLPCNMSKGSKVAGDTLEVL